jgi:hypothetical protein
MLFFSLIRKGSGAKVPEQIYIKQSNYQAQTT